MMLSSIIKAYLTALYIVVRGSVQIKKSENSRSYSQTIYIPGTKTKYIVVVYETEYQLKYGFCFAKIKRNIYKAEALRVGEDGTTQTYIGYYPRLVWVNWVDPVFTMATIATYHLESVLDSEKNQ